VIAQNAVQHGTSYAFLHGLQTDTAPDGMVWIGQEVACKYGFCGPPGFNGTLAIPSFDCMNAKAASEKAICSNKRLARREADLSKSYRELLKKLPWQDEQALRIRQHAWLTYRNGCEADEGCLLQRMKARWKEILEMDTQLLFQSLRKDSNVAQ
jgi:uncharacterized protein YecT (DUF1311 family)